MPLETHPFDPTEFFRTPEAQAELLAEAFDTGEVGFILGALDTVARIRGMTALADEVGISRQGLVKALGEKGNPTLSTLLGLAKAMGFRMRMEPIAAE